MAIVTAEVRQNIIKLHEQGLGCNAIARKLGINAGHVSLVLRGMSPNHKRTLSNAAFVANPEAPLAAARRRLSMKVPLIEIAAIEETSRPIEAAIAPTPPPVPVIPKFVPLPGVTVSPRRVVIDLGWEEQRDTPRVSLFQHEHEGGPVHDGYGGRRQKAYIP